MLNIKFGRELFQIQILVSGRFLPIGKPKNLKIGKLKCSKEVGFGL
jgi:hypothetical protein